MREDKYPSFAGRLKPPGHAGRGIEVEISAVGDTIRFMTDGEVLGTWPSTKVQFELGQTVLSLDVDGEAWTFATRDPMALISTLPPQSLTADMSKAFGGRHRRLLGKAVGLRPTVVRSWVARLSRAPSRSASLALTFIAVFLVGYYVGRSPGRTVALVVAILMAAAVIAAGLKGAVDQLRRMRFDRATDDQTPGTEVTAKRLAEALERIAATGQSHVDLPSITDAATRDQTTAGEGDLAEPVATDQPAQPPDGALEPSPPDHAGAAVVVLDAHGQVIGRTQEPARDEKYGSGASPDREMAEPVQAETRAPLRSVTDATLEGITRAFAMVPSSANQPTTGTDDLELIHGIGPVYADALVSLGLNTFASIASLDEADIERIEGLVGPIRSRIERDRWREHAQSLDEAARASDEAVDPSSSATVEEP